MKKFYSVFTYKYLIVQLFVLISFGYSTAQTTPVFADPALGSFDITNLANTSVDANQLNLNSVYLIKLGVLNLNLSNSIPPNTCYVDIALGTKMKIDPTFDLPNAALNNYFTYTYITGTNPKIRCTLTNTLPADFAGTFVMRVIAGPQSASYSTVTGNFLISNNNPSYVLSDLAQNNTADIAYLVGPAAAGGPLPVNITSFTARNMDCNIDVNWTVTQEINLAHYDVEISKDGTVFTKVANVNAGNKNKYNAVIALTEQLKAPILFIRLKSVDADGTFKLSSIVSVKGSCTGAPKQIISCYPNPVTNEKYITIAAKGETFNGNYLISVLDAEGKSYLVTKMSLQNATSFKLDLNKRLAAGGYFIKLQKEDEVLISTLQFIKE